VERAIAAVVKLRIILRLDQKPFSRGRRKPRRAQLREARHGEVGCRQDLRLPRGVEIPDPKQPDIRRQQLLLHREQSGEFDGVGVQLDLDDRLIEDLKLDETLIFDGEGYRVVIRIGVAEGSQKLAAVLLDPSPAGRDQHGKALHLEPRNTSGRSSDAAFAVAILPV